MNCPRRAPLRRRVLRLAEAERGRFSPTVIRGDFAAALPGMPVAPESVAVDLPLYGRIAAGTPIEALRDQNASVAVPGNLIGRGEHYALGGCGRQHGRSRAFSMATRL